MAPLKSQSTCQDQFRASVCSVFHESVNKNPRTDNGEDENAADARGAVRLHRSFKVLNFHVLG